MIDESEVLEKGNKNNSKCENWMTCSDNFHYILWMISSHEFRHGSWINTSYTLFTSPYSLGNHITPVRRSIGFVYEWNKIMVENIVCVVMKRVIYFVEFDLHHNHYTRVDILLWRIPNIREWNLFVRKNVDKGHIFSHMRRNWICLHVIWKYDS